MMRFVIGSGKPHSGEPDVAAFFAMPPSSSVTNVIGAPSRPWNADCTIANRSCAERQPGRWDKSQPRPPRHCWPPLERWKPMPRSCKKWNGRWAFNTRRQNAQASLAFALPTKEILSCCFGDRQNRGMLQPAFHRYRVKLFRDFRDVPNHLHHVLATDVLGDGRWRNKQAFAGLTKDLQYGAVLELMHRFGADALVIKPLLECATERRILRRHQHRCAVQVMRKI